jgi:hypothetical protein
VGKTSEVTCPRSRPDYVHERVMTTQMAPRRAEWMSTESPMDIQLAPRRAKWTSIKSPMDIQFTSRRAKWMSNWPPGELNGCPISPQVNQMDAHQVTNGHPWSSWLDIQLAPGRAHWMSMEGLLDVQLAQNGCPSRQSWTSHLWDMAGPGESITISIFKIKSGISILCAKALITA